MTLRPSTLLGIFIGVAAAALVLGHLRSANEPPPPPGPMLGDFGPGVKRVVMQYVSGADFVVPVYRQYLHWQSPDLTVYMVCPEQEDFDEIRNALGVDKPMPSPVNPPYHLVPILTHHAMTPWSRDRWVALLATAQQPLITLLAPRGENTLGAWPEREGDSKICDDLAGALPQLLQAKRSPLYFDGGDLLADGSFVFVTPSVLQRNIEHTVHTREEMIDLLAAELHLTPVLMEDAPDHHAGMFMMAAGEKRMLVADPSLGRSLYDAAAAENAQLDGGADFSAQTQAKFDSVAKLVADHGYRVTRIGAVVPKVGKTYITYVNGIIDYDAEYQRPVYYMPAFAGQPALNAAAAEVWSSLGYEVRPIDCSTTWTRGGTLHCLVNVLERG